MLEVIHVEVFVERRLDLRGRENSVVDGQEAPPWVVRFKRISKVRVDLYNGEAVKPPLPYEIQEIRVFNCVPVAP